MALGDTFTVNSSVAQIPTPVAISNGVVSYNLVQITDPDGTIIYVPSGATTPRFSGVITRLVAGNISYVYVWLFTEVGPYIDKRTLPQVATVNNGTRDLVVQGWDRSQTFANSAGEAAKAYLTKLELVASNINRDPNINVVLAHNTLDLSQFNVALGTSPVTPNNTGTFTEIPYDQTYVDNIRTQLAQWVNGKSTGLSPTVEAAIWNRGRNREIIQAQAKSKEAVRSFAMRGFSKPLGALSIELAAAQQGLQDASATVSREVMTKQADLEQTNRRFAFEQAWKAEETMIAYTTQKMNRAVEMAKSIQQFLIGTFQQEVARYNAIAQVYSARIGGEVAVLKTINDTNIAEANMRIEAKKAEMLAYIQEMTLLVESVKAGAQVSAQIAAAALSSINLSGGLHASTADNASNSTQISKGDNTNTTQSSQVSTSTQNNTSHQTQNSTSTNANNTFQSTSAVTAAPLP